MSDLKNPALEKIQSSTSGLRELIDEDISEKRYQELIARFLKEDNEELKNFFFEKPHLLDSMDLKTLMIYFLFLQGEKIMPFHISVRGRKAFLEDAIARNLIKLHRVLFENIKLEKSTIQNLNFFSLKDVMPSVVVYWSDFQLENYSADKKDELETIISDDSNFDELYTEELQIQKHRLRAFLARRLGDSDKNQEELAKFYEANRSFDKKEYDLNLLQPQTHFNELNFKAKLDEVYAEVSKLQKEALNISGIEENTCFEFKCGDCCIHTPPAVTLLEFEYIKAKLDERGVDINQFKANAERNQKLHHAEYGSELEIADLQSQGKEAMNPNHFSHRCPFLDEKDACSIHDIRPFACRYFGLSTIDGDSVQACNYYLEQYRKGQFKTRAVYDSRIHTAVLGSANKKLCKEEKRPETQAVGTLTAWLTSS